MYKCKAIERYKIPLASEIEYKGEIELQEIDKFYSFEYSKIYNMEREMLHVSL